MKNSIVHYYSKNILVPIEDFMKKQEESLYQKDKVNPEQKHITENSINLFLSKLDTFSKLCDEEYQSLKKD